ncbi:MAG: aminoacyl-tRNA hydrolase [Terriglobales bacterium]
MPAAPPGTPPFLLLGLGNPGPEYEWTPHNFGFLLVEEVARRAAIRLRTHECQALTGRGVWQGHPLWLAQPMTYMNLSGASVAQLLAKQPVSDWLVACDELDLPLGTIRLRQRGSAGSHNGLRSIVASLGTTEFARLRLGIGPDHPVADRVGFVLGRWSKAQQDQAQAAVGVAADAIERVLTLGMARAMSQFNARPIPGTENNERQL